MEEKMNFWNWYENFWKAWAVFMGIMVASRLLRTQGLYYANSGSMIGNVMFLVIQILCVIYTSLLLFKFVKPLYERKEEK